MTTFRSAPRRSDRSLCWLNNPFNNLNVMLAIRIDAGKIGQTDVVKTTAAGLTAEDEAGAFQSSADGTAGKIGAEFGHAGGSFAYAASTSTNSLPDSMGTGSPASRQSAT